MRISDWSSDVCSSDLGQLSVQHAQQLAQTRQAAQVRERDARVSRPKPGGRRALASTAVPPSAHRDGISKYLNEVERSEERSVGKEGVSKCRSRWSRYH